MRAVLLERVDLVPHPPGQAEEVVARLLRWSHRCHVDPSHGRMAE